MGNPNSLYERVRPATWEDVVGHEKEIARIRGVLSRGWGGRAWWLSGPSGCGKTTIARLIAREGADPQSITEVESGEVDADFIHSIRSSLFQLQLGEKHGLAFIVNEAHGLKANTMRCLLTILEQTPNHISWIFTSSKEGELELFEDHADTGPLLSRCLVVRLSTYGLAPKFAAAAKAIAEREGLDGRPLPDYLKLATKHRSNFRAMLSDIDGGVMQP